MRLLLDTHICFWLTIRTDLLRPAERRAIDASDEIAFSAASIWETRLKWERRFASGERKGPVDPGDLLEALLLRGIQPLAVTADLATAAPDPPLAHTDPFDEMLLIQAQQGGYRLLTRDEKLAAHPVALIPA